MCINDFRAFLEERLTGKLATDDDKLAEIAAWEKFTLNRWGKQTRAFEAVATRGDLADFIEGELAEVKTKTDAYRVFDSAREKVAYRSIQATRLQFENEFEDTLRQAREGDLTRGQWAFRVRELIKFFGRQAYQDGLEDGGVDRNELSDEDEQTIAELNRRNSAYVTEFGETLFRAITDAEAANKPAMWYNKSISPYYDEGKLSADRNGLYEWAIGATEESCATCLKANGQRHRLKHWHRAGILPQSTGHRELECKGFNCKCNLIRVAGRARGRLDRIPVL